jgi:hypothetical protein
MDNAGKKAKKAMVEYNGDNLCLPLNEGTGSD